MRKALILTLLFFPLTILGCSKDDAIEITWAPPDVTFLTSVACPEVNAKTRFEFTRTTPRPKPDTIDAQTGKPSVSKDAAKKWIDTLEVSEARKNRDGLAVIAEHDRCRGTEPAQKPLG